MIFAQALTTLLTIALIFIGLAVLRAGNGVRAACGAGVVATGVITWLLRDTDIVHLKWVNFIYRFGPWKVYWKAALSRWDLFLLGMGFPNYHVDNAYIFLFNRGGLLLLTAFLIFILRPTTRYWRQWAWPERSVILYLFISSLTLDTIILRAVVALLITVILPVLRK